MDIRIEAAPQTATVAQTKAPRRTPRFFRAVVTIAAAATVALGLTVAGPGAGGAEAVTWRNYNAAGATDYWGFVNVNNFQNGVTRQIVGPGMRIHRTNAVAWNIPQKVRMTQELYRWNGASWTVVDALGQNFYINGGVQTITLNGVVFNWNARGYHYFVKTTIAWFDNTASGIASGTMEMYQDRGSDFRCNVAYCTPGAGYVTVN